MNDKKLIANALLEIAKRSETTFLEIGKEDKEIIDAAKKMGLELPSPDLMVMKTIYAEIDKVNLNGVVLSREAVEKGLNTLIGKQCNWEHDGAGFVCGYTISAKINGDKIETINVLFKSLFPDQADELIEKVKTNEAAVSFEIWNRNPETGESVVKELEDGNIEISPIIFHGTGVLLAHKPACPKAKIFQLVAKNLSKTAEKIIHRVFEKDLIFAQMAIEESKCKNCGTCNCEKEEKVMINCEKCGKEFESTAEEKICVECASLPKEESKTQLPEETKTEEKTVETKTEEKSEVAETKTEETKVEETKEEKAEVKPEETPKVEAETKVEEPKVEEKAEEKKEEVAEEKKEEAQPLEVIEPKIVVKVTSIYSEIVIDTFVDGTPSGAQEVKGLRVKITEYKDGTKDEVSEEVEIKKKFDFAELEAKVNEAKAEKDVEISSLKNELEKLDNEIKKLQEELGKKDQEIAELKTPKVEEKKEKELTVGAVDSEVKSELKRRANEINQIIANKGK